MKGIVLLKRVLFWLEASISMVIIVVAGAILIWVLVEGLTADNMLARLRDIGGVSAYFVDIAINKIILTEPLIVVGTVFWVGVYIGTSIYFAQTDSEKRIGKYLVPLTLFCLPVCAIAGFSMAIAGLASQGAGH
jgi:hypothetical protein